MPSAGEMLKNATEQQPQLPVWITHMWQRRVEHSRLGLVLGAGVSHDANRLKEEAEGWGGPFSGWPNFFLNGIGRSI
jgi:hypothetical protein